MVLAGCASTLDTAETEQVIRKAVTEQTGATVREVECPEDVVAKAGTSFKCTVTGADGTRGQASVTQRNDEGGVAVAAPFLHTGAVEQFLGDELEQRTGVTEVTMTCPDIVVGKVGDSFRCAASAGGTRATLEVTQRNDDGRVRWEVVETSTG